MTQRKVDSKASAAQSNIEEYEEFAIRLAKKFIRELNVPQSVREEIIGASYLGLVEAASRFEASRGVPFKAYAYHRIRGEILDTLRHIGRGRRFNDAKIDGMHGNWKQGEAFLEAYLQSSEAKNSKEEELAAILEAAAVNAISINLELAEAWSEQDAQDYLNPETVYIEEEGLTRLKRAINKLSKREQDLLKKYYFQDKSFKEIADESLDLSVSWISRMHSRALGKLKESLAEAQL